MFSKIQITHISSFCSSSSLKSLRVRKVIVNSRPGPLRKCRLLAPLNLTEPDSDVKLSLQMTAPAAR